MPHTLVFCNTIESCRRVENALRRRDRRGGRFEVHPFHGAIPAERRKAALDAFTAPSPEPPPSARARARSSSSRPEAPTSQASQAAPKKGSMGSTFFLVAVGSGADASLDAAFSEGASGSIDAIACGI